jgi:hypothetical protein
MSTKPIRRAGSALVCLSILCAGTAVPVLEADMLASAGTSLEANHSAESCATLHDHAVCVHWSGNRLSLGPRSSGLAPAPVVAALRSNDAHQRCRRHGSTTPVRSRAPPTSA